MAGALAGFEVLRCESVSYEAESRQGRRQVVDVVAIAERPPRVGHAATSMVRV